jgi:cell shape-determining protein MreC
VRARFSIDLKISSVSFVTKIFYRISFLALWKPRLKLIWKEQCAQLLERIAALEAEHRELRERLNASSNNSSKPPSQNLFRRARNHQDVNQAGSEDIQATKERWFLLSR